MEMDPSSTSQFV
jgi:hypothetical protein